jgi:hypothetical protein
MIRTHRGLFALSPHLRAPECCKLAEFVGIILCKDVGERVSLWSCAGCGTLVALHRHRVLWSVEMPPAALSVGADCRAADPVDR